MTTTIADLAHEFNAAPHEVAAFAGLDNVTDTYELDAATEATIREAWAAAPDETWLNTADQNRREEAVLEEVADIIDGAGYDY